MLKIRYESESSSGSKGLPKLEPLFARLTPPMPIHLRFSHHVSLLLSLAVPVYFGLVSLDHSVSQPDRVQDDARLHIVWLQQYLDPELFPQDPIAQYYQTIQAAGFKSFYWMAAQAGIEPLLLAKFVPTVLALVATVYLFYLTRLLWPNSDCGFWTTLLLNQNIWLKDDLISATPRAFIYPLLLAFLYYLVKRSTLPCLIAIGLMGLFYPQLVLVALGVLTLRLGVFRSGFRFNRSDHDLQLWLAAIGVGLLVILPFQIQVKQAYGAIVSAAQMQQMPEFGPEGRRPYFGVDPISFWFRGASGIRFPLFPPILWVSLALPWVLRSNEVEKVPPENRVNLRLLPQLFLASIGCYFLAHLWFPNLYLPSRYAFYSFRVGMAIAAGIVLSVAVNRLWQWRHRSSSGSHKLKLGLATVFLAAIVTVPAVPQLFLPTQGWVTGNQPQLYQFLAKQPKDSLIASLTAEADNLPAFTERSVLVSREAVLAYHLTFYREMQQRIVDLIQAQYSPDLNVLKAVIRKYGIDFWLIDRQFATPDYLTQQDWLIHSSFQPVVLNTVTRLKQGEIPALVQTIESCTALSENNLIILRSDCINGIQSGQ